MKDKNEMTAINIRITHEMHEKMKAEAKRRGIPMATLARLIWADYFRTGRELKADATLAGD